MKHTATVFRFLDKCVEDLDNPRQTFENFRLVTKIHAIQGLGIKDFVIIKGPYKQRASWITNISNLFPDVVLKYFTDALGPALTPEAATGWTNFLDLMIEVVRETARGKNVQQRTLN